jgi:hypothetical protein
MLSRNRGRVNAATIVRSHVAVSRVTPRSSCGARDGQPARRTACGRWRCDRGDALVSAADDSEGDRQALGPVSGRNLRQREAVLPLPEWDLPFQLLVIAVGSTQCGCAGWGSICRHRLYQRSWRAARGLRIVGRACWDVIVRSELRMT